MSSRTGRPGGDFSTPDVDGGGRKAYDGAVFRSENVSRSVVLARVRLHGEKRRVGCVREWCQDWYGDYPCGSVIDPSGPDLGSNRVKRGCGWTDRARYCRSAYRSSGSMSSVGSFHLGLRLARDP